jgi:hypothetical protein
LFASITVPSSGFGVGLVGTFGGTSCTRCITTIIAPVGSPTFTPGANVSHQNNVHARRYYVQRPQRRNELSIRRSRGSLRANVAALVSGSDLTNLITYMGALAGLDRAGFTSGCELRLCKATANLSTAASICRGALLQEDAPEERRCSIASRVASVDSMVDCRCLRQRITSLFSICASQLSIDFSLRLPPLNFRKLTLSTYRILHCIYYLWNFLRCRPMMRLVIRPSEEASCAERHEAEAAEASDDHDSSSEAGSHHSRGGWSIHQGCDAQSQWRPNPRRLRAIELKLWGKT